MLLLICVNTKKSPIILLQPYQRYFNALVFGYICQKILLHFLGKVLLYSESYLLFSVKEHESTDQERRERKIKNSRPDQGKVRMLTREEWDEIQEVRPRTPFESKLARPHARLRTGEPVRLVSISHKFLIMS
jgi:hypothetical protein